MFYGGSWAEKDSHGDWAVSVTVDGKPEIVVDGVLRVPPSFQFDMLGPAWCCFGSRNKQRRTEPGHWERLGRKAVSGRRCMQGLVEEKLKNMCMRA